MKSSPNHSDYNINNDIDILNNLDKVINNSVLKELYI